MAVAASRSLFEVVPPAKRPFPKVTVVVPKVAVSPIPSLTVRIVPTVDETDELTVSLNAVVPRVAKSP